MIRVLSNREEGFGLDVDQYMSYWVEAHEIPETESSTAIGGLAAIALVAMIGCGASGRIRVSAQQLPGTYTATFDNAKEAEGRELVRGRSSQRTFSLRHHRPPRSQGCCQDQVSVEGRSRFVL